ncbi:LuxR family transcriptional regulator [Nocardioides sp.]|uniref:LuxR family transcriptional regulator n=1 Tax=Nocardioides sp. TaxID=35761 RepID=UPI002622069D|nr:LuxR family transcriptional regulator [Nocardioides sp.]MDI6910712.1 LuxR C-terminal-related transcriptional regulator [Nocardioides sp.]
MLLTRVDLAARGYAMARAGRIGEALADLDQLRSAGWEDLGDLDRASVLTTALDCRLARGDLSPAMTLGEALGTFLDRPGLTGAVAHYGRGELSAAAGDSDLAAGHFARAGRLLSGGRDGVRLVPWRVGAALAAVRLGHRREGAALAREHLGAARTSGAPYAVALALRTVATVDARSDRTALLREAQDVLIGVPAARLAAQIDTDLAGLLLLSGRPDADTALALLRGAEAYAGREELWPLQSRVRRLLDRMGEPARPVRGEALAALTAAERRVARLAADGLTNRQIADRLVVTVKAVEWHLSRVYRKLGIRSRTGLPASLGLKSAGL